jgi:putative transposase
VYRLYREEGLIVRTNQRKKIARRERSPQPLASRPNQCWSMDFVSDKLAGGRSFRILTVVDQFTRECVWLEADRSMTGAKVVAALSKASAERDGRRGASPVTTEASSPVASSKLGRSTTKYGCASFVRAGP